MRFDNTEVYGFESAFHGMRNPKESWNKSDSEYKSLASCPDQKYCEECTYDACGGSYDEEYVIGPKDLKLAQDLILAGSEHRKFMRQIMVSVDITAPLYWWKEFDTYKVGTVANSTSTMHKLATTPITLECFEIDDLYDLYEVDYDNSNRVIDSIWQYDDSNAFIEEFIEYLDDLRLKYVKTKDKRYWKELIRWLPESWLQTRTVTMTYENLYAMCSKGQRRFHKLNEWSGQDDSTLPNFISWARTLPYAQELIFIDEVRKTDKELLMEDGKLYRQLFGELYNIPTENATCEDYFKIINKYFKLDN